MVGDNPHPDSGGAPLGISTLLLPLQRASRPPLLDAVRVLVLGTATYSRGSSSQMPGPEFVVGVPVGDALPTVAVEEALASFVVDVHDADDVVAVTIHGPEMVDNEVVGGLAATTVLGSGRDSEDFEPDAVEVDSDDVLPCGDGDKS